MFHGRLHAGCKVLGRWLVTASLAVTLSGLHRGRRTEPRGRQCILLVHSRTRPSQLPRARDGVSVRPSRSLWPKGLFDLHRNPIISNGMCFPPGSLFAYKGRVKIPRSPGVLSTSRSPHTPINLHVSSPCISSQCISSQPSSSPCLHSSCPRSLLLCQRQKSVGHTQAG